MKDKPKGLTGKVIWLDEPIESINVPTGTKHIIKPIEARDYCPNHSGLGIDPKDGEVKGWYTVCNDMPYGVRKKINND